MAIQDIQPIRLGPDLHGWPTPTAACRPWTRWWWHGSAVDPGTLTRLLETYRRAGLGGVEITPIYGIRGGEHRHIDYLSERWVAMLAHACREARRLGMAVDLPPGSGWKMGHADLRPEERNMELVQACRQPDPGEAATPPEKADTIEAVLAFGPDGERLRINPADLRAWRAPGAGWHVHILGSRISNERIKRPGPGGAGYSFNPISRASFEAVKPRFDALFAALPPGAIRSQFHDSFEYGGSWSREFLAEFATRCGYDLGDRLDALAGEGPPDRVERVKADYRRTYGELFLENAIAPWVAWAHEHGQAARNQAHGSPGNLLDLYAAADIPETEIFRTPNRATEIMSRFASSAAHVAGRPLVASESCTWLGEHFTVSPARVKAALDVQLLAGINHNVYHGTAYSPDDAAWPGWVFYAATQFNPQNPFWQVFPTLNEYVTRCQSMLQAGAPGTDFLLYWPYEDVLHAAPGMRNQLTVHHVGWFTRKPFGRVAAKLIDRGYSPDFVSDALLRACRTKDGRLSAPGGDTYRAVVIPPCRRMPLATLTRILELAQEGVPVLFLGNLPTKTAGDGNRESRQRELARLSKLARGLAATGHLQIAPDSDEALRAAGVRREPMVDGSRLAFCRRAVADGHVYFIVNRAKTPFRAPITLGTPATGVVRLDPMTGRTGRLPVGPGQFPVVSLDLAAGQSTILRTCASGDAPGPDWQPEPAALAEFTCLEGPWEVEAVSGGPMLPPVRRLNRLDGSSLRRDPTFRAFAGTIRYTTAFELPEPRPPRLYLDLGAVHENARIRLNGKDLGTLIVPPFRIEAGTLCTGANVLEVEVTTLAANRIRDLDRRGVEWRIFEDINFVNIDYKPFDASNWPVRPFGLRGPVRLLMPAVSVAEERP